MEDLCRVCLKKGATFHLFDTVLNNEGTNPFEVEGIRLCDKMTICTKTVITQNDDLPKFICVTCTDELNVAYNFIQKFESSHNALLHLSKFELDKELNVKQEELNNSENEEHFEDISTELQDIKSEFEVPKSVKHCKTKCKNIRKHNTTHNKDNKKKSAKNANVADNQCTYCGVLFPCKSALYIHLRKHTGEKPYECGKCSSRYKSKGCLKRHIETKHSIRERQFMCETCGKAFYRKNEIRIHMRQHTGERPHCCPYCPKRFTQTGSLTRHKTTHTQEKLFPCPQCGKRFSDKMKVKNHLLVHTNKRSHGCHICNKVFKCVKNLKVHLKAHINKNIYTCDHCKAVFSTKGNLKKHIETLHTSKSGVCDICSKLVTDLEEHMKKHSGEESFICEHCSKSFNCAQSLGNHKLFKHENVAKFKCSVAGCCKTFPVPCMLEFHMLKYHKNHTPFICALCARGFFRLSDLSRHLKLTHNEVLPKAKRKCKNNMDHLKNKYVY